MPAGWGEGSIVLGLGPKGERLNSICMCVGFKNKTLTKSISGYKTIHLDFDK